MYSINITNSGLDLQSKLLENGGKLTLSTVALGDGLSSDIEDMSYSTPQFDSDSSKLMNELIRVPISEIKCNPNNPNQVIINIALDFLNEESYWISEVAIYDEDNILFAIGTVPPTLKSNSSSPKEIIFNFIIEVDNINDVSLVVDPSIALATTKYVGSLEDLNTDSKDNIVSAINSNRALVSEINPVGIIKFMPFNKEDLPNGWYICNGGVYSKGTFEYDVLNSFSDRFKNSWNINIGDKSLSTKKVNKRNGIYNDRNSIIMTSKGKVDNGVYKFLTTGMLDATSGYTIVKGSLSMPIYYKDNGNGTYSYFLVNSPSLKPVYYLLFNSPDDEVWKSGGVVAPSHGYIYDDSDDSVFNLDEHYHLINGIYYLKEKYLVGNDRYGLNTKIKKSHREYFVVNSFNVVPLYRGVYKYFKNGRVYITNHTYYTYDSSVNSAIYYKDNGDGTYSYFSTDYNGSDDASFNLFFILVGEGPDSDYWLTDGTTSALDTRYDYIANGIYNRITALDKIEDTLYFRSDYLKENDFYTDDLTNIVESDNPQDSDYFIINSANDEAQGVYNKFTYGYMNQEDGVLCNSSIKTPIYYKENEDGTYNYIIYGTILSSSFNINIYKNSSISPVDEFWQIDGSIFDVYTNSELLNSVSSAYSSSLQLNDGVYYLPKYRLLKNNYYKSLLENNLLNESLDREDLQTLVITSQDDDIYNGVYKYFSNFILKRNFYIVPGNASVYFKECKDGDEYSGYIYLVYYEDSDFKGYHFYNVSNYPYDPRLLDIENNSGLVLSVLNKVTYYLDCDKSIYDNNDYHNNLICIDDTYYMYPKHLLKSDKYIKVIHDEGSIDKLRLPYISNRYINGVVNSNKIGFESDFRSKAISEEVDDITVNESVNMLACIYLGVKYV